MLKLGVSMYLNNKSELNIESAEILINEHELYSSSVHCSYYAVFQKMKYIYINTLEGSYDEFDIDYRESRKISKQNSHQFLIEKFIGLYRKKVENPREAQNLRNKIFDIKVARETSDYQNIEISRDFSEKVFNRSKEVIKQIKKML